MNIRPLFSLVSCTLLSVAITACGKDEGNTNNIEEISLYPSAIDYPQAQREQEKQFNVTVNVSEGIDTSKLHLFADLDDQVFRPLEVVSTSEGAVTLKISTYDGLWGRGYSGVINLRLCIDESCENELAGSPAVLPYNITFPASQFLFEPILNEQNTEHRTVIDFGKDYTAIYVESEASGTPSATVRIETEIAEELGELILPQELLEDFQVSDVSDNGFTITTPFFDEMSYVKKTVHTFQYELGFTNSTTVIPYTIYSIEEGGSGATDQVVFLGDPIEFDAQYHSDFSFVVPFIFVGENKDDFQRVRFNINFNDLDAYAISSKTHRNYISNNVTAPYTPITGPYSGQIEALIDGEVINSVDIVGDIVGGTSSAD